jgi:hypothetical protein
VQIIEVLFEDFSIGVVNVENFFAEIGFFRDWLTP